MTAAQPFVKVTIKWRSTSSELRAWSCNGARFPNQSSEQSCHSCALEVCSEKFTWFGLQVYFFCLLMNGRTGQAISQASSLTHRVSWTALRWIRQLEVQHSKLKAFKASRSTIRNYHASLTSASLLRYEGNESERKSNQTNGLLQIDDTFAQKSYSESTFNSWSGWFFLQLPVGYLYLHVGLHPTM